MKGYIFIILILVGFSTKAQEEFNLYSGKIPNSKGCPIEEVWSEAGASRGTVRKVTVPTMKVFLPKENTKNRPAVIICPGGGYSNLSIFDGGYETAIELSKAGIVAFVLKYRLSDSLCNSNNGIIALQDAQQAIYLVRKQAQKYNVDTAKVGFLGFSAGGHLAAMASTHYNDRQIEHKDINLRPDFTILAYPIISFRDSLTAANSKSRINLLGSNVSQAQIRWYSPELNVNSDTPPAFLIHSGDDKTALVENSLSYYRALQKQNISVAMKIYQKGGHGFANYNKAEDDHWLPIAVSWLKLNGFLKN